MSGLLSWLPCREHELRVGKNERGVWDEAGCRQGLDGLARSTSLSKLECVLGASLHHSRPPCVYHYLLPLTF